MKELHRICVKNAEIRIIVPYFTSVGAHQDPSHKRFFSWKTFDYFEKENGLCFYGLELFKIRHRELRIFISRPIIGKFLSRMFTHNPLIYERFFAYVFPATEIEYQLKVVK